MFMFTLKNLARKGFRISDIGLKFDGVIYSTMKPWSRALNEIVMLGQFLHVPCNFEISHGKLCGPSLWEELSALTKISDIGLKFHKVMHSNIKIGHAWPI